MKILGIETSCDDTCIAVIETEKNCDFRILSNIASSQIKIHEKWGGVYPTLAKREHQKNLPIILKKTLKNIKNIVNNKVKEEIVLKEIFKKDEGMLRETLKVIKNVPEIDLIAVTAGPGLDPCLWTGVNFAKILSLYWEKPLVPINHIESHLLVSFFEKKENKFLFKKKEFPIIALIVSGGHTQVILIKEIGDYKIIGETRDDAAGECFDKTARIIGLNYPGGPIIEKRAKLWKKSSIKKAFEIKLPRPMINAKNFDLSFSGLKTAVLYHHKSLSKRIRESEEYINFMSYEIQQSIIDVLISKTLKAAEKYKAKSIILGGGVSSNKELRKQFLQKSKIEINFPPKKTATDNAIMIAATACLISDNKKLRKVRNIKANASLRI